MINRVVLVGRLTRDPELRNTNSGNSVVSFTVAVDNPVANPDGSKSTSFFDCTAWSKTADFVSKYARKGSLVGLEGRLNQRKYQRKDGTNANVVEIICDNVQLLEPKSANANNGTDVKFDDIPAPTPAAKGNNLDSLDLPDDDLPF